MPEFNNFKILKEIGTGAQGAVNLAVDIRLGRKVAIKTLHKDLVNVKMQKDRFISEAKLLSQINHPSIVTLYDYISDESGFHLVMEYLEGTALDDYINKQSGPIQELRAINIFTQVLDGIQFVHSRNIIHRDIKPSNILLDEYDNVKILDFGIAKNYQDNANLTIIGQNVGGTPMYMSPEHISESDIDEKSDIYSLGVVLWQMVTGKKPYPDLTIGQIYSKIERDDLLDAQEVYPHVSSRINNIIKKATNKNKKDRFDSCESFRRSLEDLKDYLCDDTIRPDEVLQKIEVKVINQNNSLVIINNNGCVGNELTYYGMPGDRVRVSILKEGFVYYFKQFTINKDRNIEVNLSRKNNKINLLISIVFIIVESLVILYLILNK